GTQPPTGRAAASRARAAAARAGASPGPPAAGPNKPDEPERSVVTTAGESAGVSDTAAPTALGATDMPGSQDAAAPGIDFTHLQAQWPRARAGTLAPPGRPAWHGQPAPRPLSAPRPAGPPAGTHLQRPPGQERLSVLPPDGRPEGRRHRPVGGGPRRERAPGRYRSGANLRPRSRTWSREEARVSTATSEG